MEKMGVEIMLPKGVKNAKVLEFIGRACQASEAKRMGRE